MMPAVLLILCTLPLVACSSMSERGYVTSSLPVGASTLAFRPLAEGAHSEEGRARAVVARTAAEYAAISRAAYPGGGAPAVDFSREMVLVAFGGRHATGGFSVAIDAVQEEPEAIRARIRLKRPAPDAVVTTAETAPFTFVAVPRSDKPVHFVGPTPP